MNRWLTVTAFLSVLALSACGTGQQEKIEEEIVHDNSTTDSMVADKKEIVLDLEEEDEASKEAKSSEEVSDDSKKKPEDREQDPVDEPGEAAGNTEEKPALEDSVEDKEAKSKPEDKKSKQQTTTNFDHYPKGQFAVDGSAGQTVKNSTGEFTIEKSVALSPVHIDPMNIHIENVMLVSGKVTEESIAGISGDHVRFLQVDAILQNTSEDPIQFFFASTTLDLNGQQLTAHSMFSGITDGNYGTQAPRNATLVYMLNENHLTTDQIKNLTVNIIANPTNTNTGEEVGKGTTLDVSF
ncbi:hypothetical protein [Oceanobacillus rekensis]|uniref:hypothetical protein n=1 Tax=Oceanobacillus rekensis TaxID=937927 RepID=UPI000B43BC51|nr:hypothetical protein [Oceanobacillus rekensis]